MFSAGSEAKKEIPKKLTEEEIKAALEKIPGWEINAEKNMIFRNYKFPGFKKAITFVNSVAGIADQERHHPDIHVGFGYCKIHYTTHDVKGLSEKDFASAAKINALDAPAPKPTVAP